MLSGRPRHGRAGPDRRVPGSRCGNTRHSHLLHGGAPAQPQKPAKEREEAGAGAAAALAQAEGLRKSRQAACQGRAGAREGCQPAEGRPAQVHDACGGRKPKHRGRGPERQGHAEEPPPRQGRGRCRHVGAGAPARVQMRMVGARLRKGGQVLSVQQDVFRMRLRLQGTDAGRTGMGLPRVRHASRPRPERRRQHRPRGKENPGRYRRACGNRGRRRKRLWRGRKTYGCMRSLGNSR